MLDVHPPHAPTHTWKDFFIHIATIVVGLLIAVGLEQTVEFLHHRHELRETQEALHQEREENRRLFAINTAEFLERSAQIDNNLRVLAFLRDHPGTPEEDLPGVLLWGQTEEPVVESAWKNAQQTQVLARMPRKEAEDDAQLYRLLEDADAATTDLWNALQHAGSYAFVDPDPSHLTPAQLDRVIEDTKLAAEINVRWGVWLLVLHHNFPEFSPGPTPAEVNAASKRTRSAADIQKLAAALAKTDAALAPSRAANQAARKANGDDVP